jgi:hypothetical protein
MHARTRDPSVFIPRWSSGVVHAACNNTNTPADNLPYHCCLCKWLAVTWFRNSELFSIKTSRSPTPTPLLPRPPSPLSPLPPPSRSLWAANPRAVAMTAASSLVRSLVPAAIRRVYDQRSKGRCSNAAERVKRGPLLEHGSRVHVGLWRRNCEIPGKRIREAQR